MKKFLTLLLIFGVISSSVPSSFAVNKPSNTNSKYSISNTEVVSIPIYGKPLNEDYTSARGLQTVATLSAWTETYTDGTKKLFFQFVPTDPVIALLTYGFTGNLHTFHNTGVPWSRNNFTNVLSGSCECASGGTATLGGRYKVAGYEVLDVTKGYAT